MQVRSPSKPQSMLTSSGEDISCSELLHRIQADGTVVFAFRTPADISELATFLAAICPSPDTTTVGLIELMANAVEHGLLQIGHQTKLHLRRNLSLEDEIERRLSLPEYADLTAHIEVTCHQGQIFFRVSDPGLGFDWTPFEHFCHDRALDPSGRGIAIARSMGFTSVEYLGCGNQVLATVKLPPSENPNAAD